MAQAFSFKSENLQYSNGKTLYPGYLLDLDMANHLPVVFKGLKQENIIYWWDNHRV